MLDPLWHQHWSGPRSGLGGQPRLAGQHPFGSDIAAVDPDLDADPAIRRMGVDLAVADVRAQRTQRDAALLVPLPAAHLGAAEAPGHRDLDALGAGLHR